MRPDAHTVDDFEARQINGQDNGQVMALSAFKGQVMLIVNTASQCGFTPQFGGLEELHKTTAAKAWRCWGFRATSLARKTPALTMKSPAFARSTTA